MKKRISIQQPSNNIVTKVLNLLSPRSAKSQNEEKDDILNSPPKQQNNKKESKEANNKKEEKEFNDNTSTNSLFDEKEKENEGWINPDLVLQKKKRVLQTSALGHGNEIKDEDFLTLSKNYSQAFNDKNFSDVIFKIGPQGKILYAHKVIIGNRSLYFRGVLSKSNSTKVIELSYPEFSYPIFEQVVQYMYTGKINLKLDNVLDTFQLSDKI